MREASPDQPYADATLVTAVMDEFIQAASGGRVVYLTKDGSPAAAVVPLDVAEAGLRALGRTADSASG